MVCRETNKKDKKGTRRTPLAEPVLSLGPGYYGTVVRNDVHHRTASSAKLNIDQFGGVHQQCHILTNHCFSADQVPYRYIVSFFLKYGVCDIPNSVGLENMQILL